MFLPDPFAKAQEAKKGDADSVDDREMTVVENEPLGSRGHQDRVGNVSLQAHPGFVGKGSLVDSPACRWLFWQYSGGV